ncbi:hypothetical protein CLV98_11480 [Dyadobacter jejuensis]|uniref:Uncharacterized protein n=1 Tax=Dyadobacter jejuensis TaxID=1082580 RepID=A0A316ACF5_9BACT|nr:hypothetical protein [Dyadobacter jejuensis]PWJ55311.1 hypothetical protein CLV98_11480 [Dyadobacter jejuensis]
MEVTWKTNLWKQEYRLFRGKLIVGLLKKKVWSNEAYGEFNGALLRFKPKGLWKTDTLIRDIENQRTLGQIHYQALKGSAVIEYEQQEYLWKFDNWKKNSWSVGNDTESARFNLNVWKSEGHIEIDYLPAAVVLAGLYTQSYYSTILAT